MKWIARPINGRWTGRNKKEAEKVGFFWDGNDCSCKCENRPKTPWGCRIRKYKAPASPRKGFGAVVGIMMGTHDEFGKPK